MINVLYKQKLKSRGMKRFRKASETLSWPKANSSRVIVLQFLLVKKLVSIKTSHGLCRDKGPLSTRWVILISRTLLYLDCFPVSILFHICSCSKWSSRNMQSWKRRRRVLISYREVCWIFLNGKLTFKEQIMSKDKYSSILLKIKMGLLYLISFK